MIITITTLYEGEDYKNKHIKIPENWLIIVEKNKNEINIKLPNGEIICNFKTKGLIKYEISKTR